MDPDEELSCGAAVQGVILAGEILHKCRSCCYGCDSAVNGSGNCWSGGEDFDNLVVDLCMQEFKRKNRGKDFQECR